ncbi:unnamed protein product, partial [Meganyctiphanes norvegica]
IIFRSLDGWRATTRSAGFNSWGGATMWFPATDRVLEGRLMFTDGKGMDVHGDAMLWRNGMIMQQNSEEYDCVGYRTDNAAYMYTCDAQRYPMICEKPEDLIEVSFTGVLPKASSSISGWPPSNAIGNSAWHNSSPYVVPSSLWFEFPVPIRVLKYSFTSRVDHVDYVVPDGPSKYFFWGSNHNDCSQETSRVVLYEDNSGTPFERTNKPKTKRISHSDFYRCYGFTVTDVPGRIYNGKHIKAVTIGNVLFYSEIVVITAPPPTTTYPVYTPDMTDCVPVNNSGVISSVNGSPITLYAPSADTERYSGVIKVFYGPDWESSRILTVDLSQHAQHIGNGIIVLVIWPKFQTRSSNNEHFSFVLTTNRSDSDRYDDFTYIVYERELLLEYSNMGNSIWYQNCYPEPESTTSLTPETDMAEEVTTSAKSTSDMSISDPTSKTFADKESHTSVVIGITVIILVCVIAIASFLFVKKWREKAVNRDANSRCPEGEANRTYHYLKDENLLDTD